MSSTMGPELTGHLIARFSTRLQVVLDGLLHVSCWSMTPAEQRVVVVELSRAEARLGELRLRVLAAADCGDVGAESGASSTAAWLAQATRRAGAAARREVKLARQLDGEGFAATREALARGLVDVGQARVIVAAVQALPDAAEPWVRKLAEQRLIALAADHDEKKLKMLGRRVFEVVDPQAADAEDGRRLEGEEAAAARRTFLHLFDNGDGTHTGRFRIASLHAAMLKKMIEAIIGPRRTQPTSSAAGPEPEPEPGSADGQPDPADPADQPDQPDPADQPDRPGPQAEGNGQDAQKPQQPQSDPSEGAQPEVSPEGSVDDTAPHEQAVSRPEQLGEAFGHLLERIPADRLPTSGGVSATVVVLLDYDKLLSGVGAAQLDTGEHISASLARRLACEAGVIPAVYKRVLAGRSVILDMGRTTRFHTEHQRIAMSIEQGGCCGAEGCDRPAGWCQAHHPVPWAQGGGTSLRNGRLLCAFHHGKAHQQCYDSSELPNGKLAFHRRT